MPWGFNDTVAAHNAAAGQAKSDALNWLLPLAAIGGTSGVLSGLWNRRQKNKQVGNIQDELNYPAPTVPLGLEKSASPCVKASFDLGGLLAGDHASRYGALSVPWFPAAALATLYGSYSLGRGGVNSLTNNNIENDTEEDSLKSKQKYLQAVKQPAPASSGLDMTEPVMSKAATIKQGDGYPFFSLGNWGPELSLGIGALGGLGTISAIRGYQKAKEKSVKDEAIERQKALEASIAGVQPPAPARLPQPVSFS